MIALAVACVGLLAADGPRESYRSWEFREEAELADFVAVGSATLALEEGGGLGCVATAGESGFEYVGGLPTAPTGKLMVRLELRSVDGPVAAWIDLATDPPAAPPRRTPVWLDTPFRMFEIPFSVEGLEGPPQLRFHLVSPAHVVVRKLEVWIDTGRPVRAELEVGGQPRVLNGGFELGTFGWAPLGTTVAAARTDRGPAANGDWCLLLDTSPGARPIRYVVFPVPDIDTVQRVGVVTDRPFPLTPGRRYAATAYLRSEPEGAQVAISMTQPGDSQARAQVTVGSHWRRYHVNFTAEGDCGYVAIEPLESLGGRGQRVWIDSVRVAEQGTAPGDAPPPFELAVTTGRPGNVFEADRPLSLDIAYVSHAEPSQVPVHVEVTDLRGNAVCEAWQTLSLGGQGSRGSVAVPLEVEGNGYFNASVACDADGVRFRRDVRLARFAVYTHEDSPFGVSWGWESDLPFELARRAGVRWVRDWSVRWDVAQPKQDGDLDLLTTYTFLDRYHRLGLRVLECLPYPSTVWASSDQDGRWRREGVRQFVGPRAYLPQDPSLLTGYLSEYARRYGDRFDAFEVLQEPLVAGSAMPAAAYSPEDYVALCVSIGDALEEEGWDGLLIGGTGAFPFDPTLLPRLETAGLSTAVDAWNLHAYPFAMPGEALAPWATPMGELSGERGYWVTELGISGDDEPAPIEGLKRLWAGSELAAADRMVRASALLMVSGARKVFFSASSRARYEARFGSEWLFTPAGEPRVCLPVLAALARRLGPEPVAEGTVEAEWGTAYLFETGGNAVAVLCPRYGGSVPSDLLAGVEPAARLYDLCGNTLDAPAPGDLPIYAEMIGVEADALREVLSAEG